MHPRPYLWILCFAVALSCGSPRATSPAPGPSPTAPPLTEDLALEAPRIPVPTGFRPIQTLAANLDDDADEEQLVVLQDRSNLSLPAIVWAVDWDSARQTYYQAWEGTVLASAGLPLWVTLEDLIGDHRVEVVINGRDETDRETLDVLRPIPPVEGVGLAYKNVFSIATRGSLRLDTPERPDSYRAGQDSDRSTTITVDEPDPESPDGQLTLRTTWTWLYQKGEYAVAEVQRLEPENRGDSVLETLFSGDNAGFFSFLQGPWLKAVPDKTGPLILFLDPSSREITFATSSSQEVYRWEATSRSSRASLFIGGRNELIDLIRLQLGLTVTGVDTIEIGVEDNPTWAGTYRRLDSTAAFTLTHQGTEALPQAVAPSGTYRDDAGNEFDFRAPEIRLVIDGVERIGTVAVYPLGQEMILQIKVPSRPGLPGLSRAYSLVAQEERSTSRVVRTLRLQGGVLSTSGWISDQTDPLRLEQVEAAGSGTDR